MFKLDRLQAQVVIFANKGCTSDEGEVFENITTLFSVTRSLDRCDLHVIAHSVNDKSS